MSKRYTIYCKICQQYFKATIPSGTKPPIIHSTCGKPIPERVKQPLVRKEKYQPIAMLPGCDCFDVQKMFNITGHLKWCQTRTSPEGSGITYHE